MIDDIKEKLLDHISRALDNEDLTPDAINKLANSVSKLDTLENPTDVSNLEFDNHIPDNLQLKNYKSND